MDFRELSENNFQEALWESLCVRSELTCEICVDIVTDIDNFITSDSTEQDIIEFVENVSTENDNEVLEYHSEL